MTSWYPTSESTYGGVFVREYAKAARAAGNEVVVLHLARASKKHRGLWKMEEELDPKLSEGIPAHHVYHRSMPLRGTSYPLYLWSASKAFHRLRADGFEPDVIHAHIYDAGVPAVMIGKRFGIPVVITEHFSGFPQRTLSRAAVRKARYAYRNADRALPVSMYLQRAIAAYGIEAKFEVVPNVVDTSLFFTEKRKLKKTGEKQMVFVGNFEPPQYKGYPSLLEALALLGQRRSDWRLDVIGDGPERAEYERRTVAAGLPAPVVFYGAKPKSEIAEMMRRSDLFVLPSKMETFGCVLAEALASGLPVVSTTVGNVPSVVPGDAGILVSPDNPPALADALDSVLSNINSYDRVEIATDARSRYSLEAVGAQLQEIYGSVLSASATEIEAGTSNPAES